jgi:hypothetical protein
LILHHKSLVFCSTTFPPWPYSLPPPVNPL